MDRRDSMNTTKLKQEIIEYSKEIVIDKIGFASTDVFNELKHRLKQQEKYGYASGFEKGSIKERTEPSELLPEAQSIISIALAYPTKTKNPTTSTKEDRRENVSRTSCHTYYKIVV